MQPLLIPVSAGELLDKISILEIRVERVTDPLRRACVQRELETLQLVERQLEPYRTQVETEAQRLGAVNRQLWQAEDEIRNYETRGSFGEAFIELARSIYRLNDERARLKMAINLSLGFVHREEKVYTSNSTP